MGKWTQAALAVKERMEQTETARAAAESARDELRSDLMIVLGRVTALKTIYSLMPENIKAVIGKYTDNTP